MTTQQAKSDTELDKTFTVGIRARSGNQTGDTVTVTFDERIAR
jgi:hypothetical protein